MNSKSNRKSMLGNLYEQNIGAQSRYSGLLFMCALVLVPSAMKAQEQGEDDIFELSPFQVSAEEDTGYQATTTLSGTRLRTSLDDVGTAVSIINEDFLEDTNSTDLRDALVYATGSEVSGIGGNFSGADGVGGTLVSDTSVNNSVGTRIRGLAEATQTRGFFRTNIPFDSYNSDRLEINRGANAMLFGVGSPAGIINYSPNLANLARRFGEVDLQFGRFDSHRVSIDLNQPLWDNQAAIRISALNDKEKFQQRPAFNRDRRVFVTGAISPKALKSDSGLFAGTTLRGSYEHGEIRANNPRTLPPSDFLTRWFEPSPEMVQAGITPKGTRDNSQDMDFSNGLFAARGLRRAPTLVFPELESPEPRDFTETEAIGRQFTLNNSSVNGNTTAMFTADTVNSALNRMGFPNASFFKTPTLNDRSVFDFRNQLIDGPNKEENTDIEAFNISIEQLFFNDRAGIEFVYDDQEVEDNGIAVFPRGRPEIEIDVNTNLVDGSPNPNFGRPWLSTRTSSSINYDVSDIETVRLTLFGELDFQEMIGGRWSSWLGTHTVSLLYQEEDTFSESRSGVPWYIPDIPWIYGNNQSRFNLEGKRLNLVQYMGPSLADATTASGANLQRVRNNLKDLASIADGRQFYLRQQAAGSEFMLVPVNVVNTRKDVSDNADVAFKTLREINSKAINLQSRLLQDQVVFNAGWRRESVDNFRADAPTSPDGQGFRLIDDPSFAFDSTPDFSVEDTLFSWSVVGKTPKGWLDRVPLISGVNFHYNESENFSPPEGLRFNAFGERLSPEVGDTEDIGFTVEIANGKAVARVNWYETSQSLVTNSTMTNALSNVITEHMLAFFAVQNGIAPDSDGDGFPDRYVPPPDFFLDLFNMRVDNGIISSTDPGVVATGDFVSEGVEVELFINPSENWSITVNASRQESVRSNTGQAAEELLFNTPVEGGRGLLPTWLDLYTVPLFEEGTREPITPDSAGTLASRARNNILNPFNNTKLQDGSPAQELREWRFNVVTNYRFGQGFLDGFNIGGAFRWQDEVAIGFPLVETEEGESVIDVQDPFFGPTESQTDFWIGYERPIWQDRLDWRIQVNLRNAFPGDDLVPVSTQPTGAPAAFRISESRVWTISSTFSF